MADADILSQKYADKLFPNTVVQLTEASFGVFGNFVVLLMYSKYIEDKLGTRYFIPILALVDLVGCISNVVQFYLDDTMTYIYPSIFLCKILSFLRIMTGRLSANIILAIALQRYLVICRPFGQQMTRKSCSICILLMFLFSVGYSTPALKLENIYNSTIKLDSGNATQNISISACHISIGANAPAVILPYFGTLLFLSFINIVVTSTLYIPVIKTIYRTLSPSKKNRACNAFDGEENAIFKGTQSSNVEKITITETQRQEVKRSYIEPSAASNNDGHREQKARKKISVMFMVIIIVYVVSYLTSLITNVHLSATGIEPKGYKLNIYYFCLRFNLLNHVANPYIYWFFDIKFRDELRRFCCDGTLQR